MEVMKMMNIESLPPDKQQNLLKALLRTDFKSFVIKVFKEVSPNNRYLDNWHVDVICHELMRITEEEDNNRLIINIPPRHMKSIICSVAYPAFILGHNPRAEIICVSYADELSSKFALDTRRVMETSWYRDIFPGARIAKDKKAVNDFNTTKGGGRYATSVNGTLTGRGADYIIIDDPIKPQDSFSDNIREKTNQWYGHTLYSRLNDKNRGKIIVIMQRIHDDDFTGYLLSSDPTFRQVKIQAIAGKDEEWRIEDRLRNKERVIRRKLGEALHPDREDIHRLNAIRTYMGEFNFSGQYQQEPAPREGALIKREWLHFYDPQELEKAIEEGSVKPHCMIQSWDTANKVEENNDYSVCLTLLMGEDYKLYLLDCYRAKVEFPELIKKVKEKYLGVKDRYKCQTNVFIEDKGSGTQLIQILKREFRICPISIKPDYDKATRLQSVSHLIENGTCLFPNNKPPWWHEFELELLRFPKTKHDDQCDALSQALENKPHVSNMHMALMLQRRIMNS
jgi:predicted phage terminase large subunit-like protein